jgi:hypothetical protein
MTTQSFEHKRNICLVVALVLLGAVASHARTWNVASFPEHGASAKINAAVIAAGAGDTLDLGGLTGTQRLRQQVVITKALALTNCRASFVETMPDPGIQPKGGGISIQANNVTFTGKPGCTITQADGANIQALIQSGASENIAFSHVKFDGNEGKQNKSDGYYSCWRASNGGGGGSNLQLLNSEITGCGDRATDWRGVQGAYQLNNYCHQSGINIAGKGLARGGDCLHVDTDGPTPSQNVWQVNNVVNEWGDSAIASPNSIGCHMLNNIIHGQAYYGHQFQAVQGGLDLSGCMNATATGNKVYDVRGEVIGMTCGTTEAKTMNSSNVVAQGNMFVETSIAVSVTLPEARFGTIGYKCRPEHYAIRNNTFRNVSLVVVGISDAILTDNTFYFDASNKNVDAIDLSGDMVNFTITGNTIGAVAMGALRIGINVQSSVTSPAPCLIADQTYTNLSASTYLVWERGSHPACALGPLVTR